MAVNGKHLLDYKHRVQDVTRIDELEIVGDLQLLDVKLWCPAAWTRRAAPSSPDLRRLAPSHAYIPHVTHGFGWAVLHFNILNQGTDSGPKPNMQF